MGNYITFPDLLLWLPFITGMLCFFIKNEKATKAVALVGSLFVLAVSLTTLRYIGADHKSYNVVNYLWTSNIGSSFYLSLDGSGRILTLLTAVSFPIILIATYNSEFKKSNAFYGLMMLAQCGLMGVFLAKDALVFYFFWELDRKSTRLNSSHRNTSRMPSSA